MRSRIYNWFLNFIVTRVFKWVTEEQLLQIVEVRNSSGAVVGHKIKHKGRMMSDDEFERITRHAELYAESLLWKSMMAEVQYHAYKMGIETSVGIDQIMLAKGAVYVVRQIDKKLKTLKRIQPRR